MMIFYYRDAIVVPFMWSTKEGNSGGMIGAVQSTSQEEHIRLGVRESEHTLGLRLCEPLLDEFKCGVLSHG